MPPKGKRTERKITRFDAFLDDADNMIHINRTVETEVTTGRGVEWSQGGREYTADVLVLTPRELVRLLEAGQGALEYALTEFTKAGVRYDGSEDKTYLVKAIEIREPGQEDGA